MNKLLIALAALALPTAAAAQHHHHHNRHHRGFNIYVNPYSNPYINMVVGYNGPVWNTGNGYYGCRQYGNNGLVTDRYGRLIRGYGPFIYPRYAISCATRY